MLNDDFEEEEALLDSTHDLLKSPDSSNSTTPEQIAPQTTKKISLKRNISIPTPLVVESKTEASIESSISSSEPDKKIVKLSEVSEMDRLEMRAKKFGGTTAVASTNVASKDKLDARAARFGIPTKDTQLSSVTTTPSADVLKKRAERFGAISSDVKKVELDEKLQKRKERFGTTTTITTEAITTGASADYAEKARLRLERFKTSA